MMNSLDARTNGTGALKLVMRLMNGRCTGAVTNLKQTSGTATAPPVALALRRQLQ